MECWSRWHCYSHYSFSFLTSDPSPLNPLGKAHFESKLVPVLLQLAGAGCIHNFIFTTGLAKQIGSIGTCCNSTSVAVTTAGQPTTKSWFYCISIYAWIAGVHACLMSHAMWCQVITWSTCLSPFSLSGCLNCLLQAHSFCWSYISTQKVQSNMEPSCI